MKKERRKGAKDRRAIEAERRRKKGNSPDSKEKRSFQRRQGPKDRRQRSELYWQ